MHLAPVPKDSHQWPKRAGQGLDSRSIFHLSWFWCRIILWSWSSGFGSTPEFLHARSVCLVSVPSAVTGLICLVSIFHVRIATAGSISAGASCCCQSCCVFVATGVKLDFLQRFHSYRLQGLAFSKVEIFFTTGDHFFPPSVFILNR
jgi:hypothetical protein